MKKSAAAKKKSAALATRTKKRPSQVKIFTSDEDSDGETAVGQNSSVTNGNDGGSKDDSQSNKRRCMIVSDSEEGYFNFELVVGSIHLILVL